MLLQPPGVSNREQVQARTVQSHPPPLFVQVIRGGPCFEVLRPGDVLLRVNGTLCTHFLPLEEALDNTLAVKQAALGLPSELGMANPRAGTGA
jgi:hypothetical protein